MWSNCCCNGPCDDACVIHSDKFDRADDTDIGADWTEDAGDWEISSNTLYTEDSNAKATWSPDPFNSYDAGKNIVAKFKGNTNGDEISIWIDSAYYIKHTIGPSGTVKIYDSTNLLLYQCSVSMTAGEWHTMSYFTGDGMFANSNHAALYINGVCILSMVLLTVAGTRVISVETGTVTSSVAVDFVCIKHDTTTDAGCPNGLTWPWVRGEPLEGLQLVVAGAINDGVVDYTPLNGTYNLSVNPGDGYGTVSITPLTFTIGANTFTVDTVIGQVLGGSFADGNAYWEISAAFLDQATSAYRFAYVQAFGNDAAPPVGMGTTLIQDGLCDTDVTLQPFYFAPSTAGVSKSALGTGTLSYTL